MFTKSIPVHPVRFKLVHVSGREGRDLNVVFPVKLREVILVPNNSKLTSPTGNVGNVVSAVQPLKSREVTLVPSNCKL